ncbi:MAG: hypothetical protein ACK6DV_17660, partial [Deltaproteobacteria bacterium]
MLGVEPLLDDEVGVVAAEAERAELAAARREDGAPLRRPQVRQGDDPALREEAARATIVREADTAD